MWLSGRWSLDQNRKIRLQNLGKGTIIMYYSKNKKSRSRDDDVVTLPRLDSLKTSPLNFNIILNSYFYLF